MAETRRKLVSLDNCAVQRLWDAQSNVEVVAQTAAVREIIKDLESHQHRFLLTWALWWEIDRVGDVERRARSLAVLPDQSAYAGHTDEARTLAKECVQRGLAILDAYHVAMSWCGGADVLFTTDNDILAFGVKHRDAIPDMVIADPCDRLEVL